MDVIFPVFQSLGISSDCHDLSKMGEASQWQETAFFLLDAPCLIPFPQVLPDINFFYDGYCFTLADSAHRLQPGTWEAFIQASAVKTEEKKKLSSLSLKINHFSWAPLPSRAAYHEIRSLNETKSANKFRVFSSTVCPIFFCLDFELLIFMAAVTKAAQVHSSSHSLKFTFLDMLKNTFP